ncbi:MAG: hypothetical protein LBH29_04360 [Elusimicrobiota bacterium]|jgi:hypothetical protein|nr:hypothetical protein [Elusimicrobiota bacterium]
MYQNNNYIPPTFSELLEMAVQAWNGEFGTDYDVKTFEGTNAYRFVYVFLQMQIQQQASVAEIYSKLQDYFNEINAIVQIPATTNEGLIDEFKRQGFAASVRNNTQAQAGKIAVAVDIDAQQEGDNWETKKRAILEIIKDNTMAGLYYEGTQSGDLQLSNGQVKTFRFTPAVKIPTEIKLTITYERGSHYARETGEEVKTKLLENLKNLYGIGADFTPERYYQIDKDAPYASKIKLEYKNSTTNNAFSTAIYAAAYTELFTFNAENIEVYFNE